MMKIIILLNHYSVTIKIKKIVTSLNNENFRFENIKKRNFFLFS